MHSILNRTTIGILAVALLATLVLNGTLSRDARADSGEISGQAEVLDITLLDLVQANIGQVTLPSNGNPVGGPLANLDLLADGVGAEGILTADAPLTANTVYSECEGTPGPADVEAHCSSGVEDLSLGLGLSLLGGSVVNVPIITATVIQADALSTGSGGTLESTAEGSTITGLTIGDTTYTDLEPGMVIPVNITVDLSDSIEISSEQMLEDLGLGALGAELDSIVEIVDDLLFAQDEGVLSTLTNTLGIDAEVTITGSVTVLDMNETGNGTTSTGVSVTALAADLEVGAELDIELLSEFEVRECEGLIECALASISGLVDDILSTVGDVVGGLLSGLGFGDEGDIDASALVDLEIGVIQMDLVSANSAIANYEADLAPVITDIDPDQGPTAGGTVVVITGENFTGTTSVTFDGVPATDFEVDNDGQITATTPPNSAVPADVVVTTPDGNDTVGFTYVAPPAPSVTGIDPDEGPTSGGTVTTITGDNFTGVTSVTFGGTPATSFTVNNDGQITATSPAHSAGLVNVVVTGPGGSDSLGFTYIARPNISGMSPTQGPTSGGTNVTIIGSGFTGTTDVEFGGTPATSFTVVNNNQITAVFAAARGRDRRCCGYDATGQR